MKLDFSGLLSKKVSVEVWFLASLPAVSLIIGGFAGLMAIVIGWIILLFVGMIWYVSREKPKTVSAREPANREA